jgi:DNA repair ATPase RecN
MTKEQIRERLLQLHRSENALNKEMSKIDFEVRQLGKKKAKLQKMVSSNMKYRNQLINKL